MSLSKTKGRKMTKAQADDLKFKKCKTSSDTIKAARERAAQIGDNPVLAEHAAVIRRLGKRVLVDTIEIGKRLTEAKKIVGHGKWAEWLNKEFGWSADTALNFMRIFADVFGVPAHRTLGASGASLGAAMCAAVATGVYPDFATAAAAMAGERETFAPDLANTATYARVIDDVYTLIRAATDPILERSFPIFR